MARNDIRHLLIVGDEWELHGVVSHRDLVGQTGRVQQFVPRPIYVAREEEPLHLAVEVMVREGIGSVPVIRGEREPVGIVTRVDVIEALLAQIADNLARDQLRRAKRDLGEETGEAALGQVSLEPTQEYAITLKEIVLSLPPKLRDVFVLSHIEGLTYQEISRLLGIPVTTVHHRMRKALEHTSSAMRD